MDITLYQIAQRFVGLREMQGKASNPAILAMLQLDQDWPKDDEVPWCSAFLNYCAWLLNLPRSKSLLARSWLDVGHAVEHQSEAAVGFDVVILSRDPSPTAGHVGLFAGMDFTQDQRGPITLLGGNQGNAVSLARFPADRILGIRRLA